MTAPTTKQIDRHLTSMLPLYCAMYTPINSSEEVERMRLLLVLAATATLAGTIAAQTRPQADRAQSGNAENGKKLFSQYGCYQCHGYAAQGGVGPRLAPRPLAFAAFSKYLRQPTGEMPPYTVKVVSESQLADLYAYLQSIPPPPSVESIPLLK
jgi:mono/diheme cytochrome c family protein